MRRFVILLMIFAILVLATSYFGFAQEKSKFQYIGADKCKMCHNLPKKGAQYKKWSESPHANAYTALASDEAKKIAKEKGIADPQKADACLKCHVTGYGKPADMFQASFNKEEGVGCEACHGPGSEYKSMKIMKDLYAGKAEPKTVGLVLPTAEVCKTCHNPESPTYKEFKFDEFWQKIAHSIPKGQ
jgi:hypothetical protein